MKSKTNRKIEKFYNFPLTKIIIGLITVISLTALSGIIVNLVPMEKEYKSIVYGVVLALITLVSYSYLYKFYERRNISELSFKNFGANAALGLFVGFLLQSLVVLVMYLAGDYHVMQINPFINLLPSFIIALTSGVFEEIIMRGIIFRLTEEKLGTIIALIISAFLFGLLHLPNHNATLYSAFAIAMEAGILLAAIYVYTRSLWSAIFLHFAWNFAESGIYGGILSGNVVDKSLVTAQFTGSDWITGGSFGPENSVQALIFCTITGIIFLWLAHREHKFIAPYWKK